MIFAAKKTLLVKRISRILALKLQKLLEVCLKFFGEYRPGVKSTKLFSSETNIFFLFYVVKLECL
jgi:hypothetical protein